MGFVYWFRVRTILAVTAAVVVLAGSGGRGLAQADAGTAAGEVPEATPRDAGWTDEGRECVRQTIESLAVVKPDVGRSQLRRRAKEICPKPGLADGASEESTRDLAEMVGDALTTETGAEFATLLVMFAVFSLMAWLVSIPIRRWSSTAESLRDPAFEVEISVDRLREDPELLDEVRDEIEAVGIYRAPQASGGRYGGSAMQVSYAAFVIDVNGETHDVAESKDWAEIEEEAEWLADALGVPLKDETYG